MALTSRPKGDKISKQQGAGEVSQYIQHKRGAGRCKAPWTWPKGAREQWGGNAPPVPAVTGSECLPRAEGEIQVEPRTKGSAEQGTARELGPERGRGQGRKAARRPARVVGKATERPDPCAA